MSRVSLFCYSMGYYIAHQHPLSMGFPRQEYWNGLSFPSPGDLPDPGIEPESLLHWQDSLPLSHLGRPNKGLLDHGGFPCSSVGKASACNVGDLGSIPELGRSPGEGNGNPLQYSCLGNPMDRGA